MSICTTILGWHLASCSGVMRHGVGRNRAFDDMATRCDTAQQGLQQPFSALGAMATEKSRMASAGSAASGTQLNLLASVLW